MRRFEYEMTIHRLERENPVRIFCSEGGECSVEQVRPTDSAVVLAALNQRGREGWELIEILFGRDGFLCFWKRELGNDAEGM